MSILASIRKKFSPLGIVAVCLLVALAGAACSIPKILTPQEKAEAAALEKQKARVRAALTQANRTKEEKAEKEAEAKLARDIRNTTFHPVLGNICGVDFIENKCEDYSFSFDAPDGLFSASGCKTTVPKQKVNGYSRCSTIKGEWAKQGNPTDFVGQYCWCRLRGKNRSDLGEWVFDSDAASDDGCAGFCADYCGSDVRHRGGRWNREFRRALCAAPKK